MAKADHCVKVLLPPSPSVSNKDKLQGHEGALQHNRNVRHRVGSRWGGSLRPPGSSSRGQSDTRSYDELLMAISDSVFDMIVLRL